MAINNVVDVARYVASQIGADPLDVLTAMSYETGGTFNPNQKGPTTKHGQHEGLIQWGGPQRERYLNNDMSLPSQAEGMVKYFKDAGFKPGMGYADLYSAINAGSVGRYGASDEAAGGAPGDVLDKVNSGQMAQHRAKAARIMGGDSNVPVYAPTDNGGHASASPVHNPSAPRMKVPGIVMALAYGNKEEAQGDPVDEEKSTRGGIFGALKELAPAQETPQLAPMQPANQSGPALADYVNQYIQSKKKQKGFV